MLAPSFVALLGMGAGFGASMFLGKTARARGGRGERRPAPLGLALAAGLLASLGYWLWGGSPTLDAFYSLETQNRLVAGLVVSVILHLLWGMWMDLGRGGLRTLLVLALGQALMWRAGLHVGQFRLPYPGGGTVELSAAASLLVTMAWLTVVAAVVEWLDGIDGVALGATGLAALAIFLFARWKSPGDRFVEYYAAILAAGCLALLPLNLPRRPRYVLGKAGSLALGHLLAVLTVLARLKGPAAGMLLPAGMVAVVLVLVLFRFLERSLDAAARPDGPASPGAAVGGGVSA